MKRYLKSKLSKVRSLEIAQRFDQNKDATSMLEYKGKTKKSILPSSLVNTD